MFFIWTKKNKPAKKLDTEIQSVTLDGYDLEIHRKAYRRRVSIQLKPNRKIKVLANQKTSLKVIEDFVKLKKTWIEKHFQKFSEMPQKKNLHFKTGEEILILGERRNLRIQLTPLKTPFFKMEDLNLNLYWPEHLWSQGVCAKRADELLQKYLAKLAQNFLTERTYFWAEQMQAKPSAIKFRKNKSRWGSCSSRGVISLNWILISAPDWVIDSVVVHELAHLKHLNHSFEFWALVETHFPRYSDADQWLRKHQFLL